jgi:hypothetical protein
MSSRELPEKFLVAFSFAGEQRDLVRAVVEAVERQLGAPNVFFDEWFEPYIAGGDSDLKLQEIYGKRSVLAVVCVSERYGGKPWTRAEHRAIRARQMQSQNESDELGILPIRVGDGEVEGILFNAIVPDIRGRTPEKAAELIIARLDLIRPAKSSAPTPQPAWPELPPDLLWPMADHTDVRAAFERLLTREAPWRFLPVKGPSESGKSQITRQMLANALRVQGLACGRFDFKGTTELDNEVRSFVQELGVPVPSTGGRLNARLGQILDALKQSKAPALLMFDTYEVAGEGQEWVEKELLPSLIRCKWLRVIITGQEVPKSGGEIWENDSAPVFVLKVPPPPDWWDFGKRYRPELTLADVESICRVVNNKPSLLAQIFGPQT